MEARVTALEGDLADVPPLPADLDALVHCAGDVSFDPPVDEGFRTNVVGTRDLLARMAEAGGTTATAHYVHISTAYVAGRRRGVVAEGPVEHAVDLAAELTWGLAQRQSVEHRSRTASVLEKERRKAEKAHSRAGMLTAARATEEARREWVKDELVALGHRARALAGLDRLLHLHQGPRRARRRGARQDPARLDRAAEHHRVRAGPPAPGLDRGLQDGRAADPGLRPWRAAGVPGRRRHHRRHRAGRPRGRRDRRRARAPAGDRRGGVLPRVVGLPQPADLPEPLQQRAHLLRQAPLHRQRARRRAAARLAVPRRAGRRAAALHQRARPQGRRLRHQPRPARRPHPRPRPQARPAGPPAGVPAALPRPLPGVRAGRAEVRRHEHPGAVRVALRRRPRRRSPSTPRSSTGRSTCRTSTAPRSRSRSASSTSAGWPAGGRTARRRSPRSRATGSRRTSTWTARCSPPTSSRGSSGCGCRSCRAPTGWPSSAGSRRRCRRWSRPSGATAATSCAPSIASTPAPACPTSTRSSTGT